MPVSYRVLTLCGSLRHRSSNRAILHAHAIVAGTRFRVTHFDGVGELPYYNPDIDCDPLPPTILHLRAEVRSADAIIISTPEYAHALPGAFKNALDWLVGDLAFAGKPVVILHASRGSSWALESLREVLRTMSADVVTDACAELRLVSNALDPDAILSREDLRSDLEKSVLALLAALDTRNGGNSAAAASG